MKAKHRRQLLLQAEREIARAEEARADARADTRLALGPRAKAYSGVTPTFVDGKATCGIRVFQARMSSHEGSTRRSGKKGTLKLVPTRHDAGAPKHGGAHLTAGEWLDRLTGEPRVASTSAIATTNVVARRDAVRCGPGPVTVLRGDDDVELPESTDPGDDDKTTLERAYWARVHAPATVTA